MLQNVLVRLLINNTVKFFYGYAASFHGFSAYILQTKSEIAKTQVCKLHCVTQRRISIDSAVLSPMVNTAFIMS